MSDSPHWIAGREPWLAGVISVVLVAGVVGAAVVEPPFQPLDADRVRRCAVEASVDLVDDPTLLQAVRVNTDDDVVWSATVGGNASVLTIDYRERDGVVVDAALIDHGGVSELDAVARAQLLDDICD